MEDGKKERVLTVWVLYPLNRGTQRKLRTNPLDSMENGKDCAMEEILLAKQKENNLSSTTRGVYLEEMKRVGFLAAPLVAVTFSQYMLQIITMMMVGHLGALALSSTAIAVSISAVTGFSVLVSSNLVFHFNILYG